MLRRGGMPKFIVVVHSLSHVSLLWYHGLQHTGFPVLHFFFFCYIISQSLPKFMSIESIMPSNHVILCCHFSCPLPFPASGSFPVSQFFASGGQSIGASASVLPMNSQGWFHKESNWFDLLAVQEALKSLLQHCNSKASILWCSAFFMDQFSYLYMTTGKNIALTILFCRQSDVSAF